MIRLLPDAPSPQPSPGGRGGLSHPLPPGEGGRRPGEGCRAASDAVHFPVPLTSPIRQDRPWTQTTFPRTREHTHRIIPCVLRLSQILSTRPGPD